MSKAITAPPEDLSTAAKSFWQRLVAEYRIVDTAGLMLLEQALRSFDRAEEARKLIDVQGAVLSNGKSPKQHPACQIERDSRAAMVKTLGALGIDGAPGGI